jgi:NADPH-dependent 7-cyano-7-deazaguanine reductase QueF
MHMQVHEETVEQILLFFLPLANPPEICYGVGSLPKSIIVLLTV